jgi:hypothetical protein
MDHVSAWTDKSGQRLLICQPYGLRHNDVQSLLEACEQFDLKAEITSTGFYGHGTICIILTSKEG